MKQSLVQPVISEKSYRMAQEGIYTFLVSTSLNKKEIKDAVESKFKVTVVGVNTVTIPGKRVRFGMRRKIGRRSDRKKALVELKDGDKISVFEV